MKFNVTSGVQKFPLQKKMLLVFFLLMAVNLICWSYYSVQIQKAMTSNEIAQKSYSDVLILSNTFRNANDQMQLYMRSGDFATYLQYEENCLFLEANLPLLSTSTEDSQEQALIRGITNAVNGTFSYYNLSIHDYQHDIPDYFFDYYSGNKIAKYGYDYFDAYLNFLMEEHLKLGEYMEKRANLVFFVAQAVLIVGGFLYFVLAIVLSNWLTEPITNLVKAAQEISRGNYDFPDLPIKHQDELGRLTSTFNIMKEDISQAIEFLVERVEVEKQLSEAQIKEVEQSKLLKEAQYSALQSQMNPHFLFNTLNAISRTIEFESKEVAVNLVYSLATICRYNLDHASTFSTIAEELYVTNQYIYIQQHRFDERIAYIVDCDEDCKEILLPSLLLQPLVENALKHGIENMVSGGKIYVKVKKKDDYLSIRVYDNGVGVEKERLLLLSQDLDEISKGHTTGIGLGNIIKRIKMMGHGTIQVKSSETKGTLVKISLPLNIKQEE